MSTYRLLRSNKESGPFSTEELVANGFKPYDLIWVEGKSAGWRYASELPEFAHLAPIVEEQPYDRFYKKNVSPKSTPVVDSSPAPVLVKEPVTSIPVVEKLPEVAIATTPTDANINFPLEQKVEYTLPPVIGKEQRPMMAPSTKKVHVVFPAGSRSADIDTQKQDNVSDVKPVPVFIAATQSPSAFEKEKPLVGKIESEKPSFSPFPKDNNSFSRQEQFTSISKQQKPAISWGLMAAFMIGIGTLLGLGLLIGISIKNNSSDSDKPAYTNILPPNSPSPASVAAENKTIPDDEATTDVTPAEISLKSEVMTQEGADIKKAVSVNPKKASTGIIEEGGSAIKKSTVLKEDKESEIENSHSLADKAENLIEVTTNTYSVGAFGGISNLQCILVNNSTVSFETVEVAVEYVQANKKVYKREIIYFKDVRAGQQLILNAPKSTRGIKVVSKIVKAKTTNNPPYTTIKS